VPHGTPAALALTLRGADHDLDFAAGDSVESAFSVPLSIRNAVGGRRRLAFSSFGGALSGYFLTNGPAVIAQFVHGAVPTPAKLRALWLYFIGNGVPANTALSLDDFEFAADAVFATIDMNNIPPAFLLTAADLYLTEVPAGALGGGGTQWLRSASFGHFSEDVPDHPGLVRLRWLGAL